VRALLLATLLLPALLAGQSVNLALQGTASQSSTSWGASAERAIDGDRDGLWGHGSVTMTGDAPGSWWQVSFAPNYVHEIALFNRSDSAWQRLSNFRVDVIIGTVSIYSRNFCTDGSWIDHGFCARMLLPQTGLPADTVRVTLLGPGPTSEQVLSLAEVEVLHYTGQPEVNLARYGTASLTNQAFGTTGAEAIDGEFDGVLANGSVAQTLDAPGSAWRVQLPYRTDVHLLRIWNRTDCCAQRLSNFRVSVLDAGREVYGRNFYTNGGSVPIGAPESIALPIGLRGDAVQIQLLGPGTSGEQVLALAEVEVIRYGIAARYLQTANGCSISGAPTLRANGASAPILGTTFQWQVSGMTSTTTMVAMLSGVSSSCMGTQPLPLDLSSLGAPGCQLLTSCESVSFHARTTSSITGSTLLPIERSLLGLTIYQQAASLDAGVNALGASFSNGAQMILGS
jgi:hypothetical protein